MTHRLQVGADAGRACLALAAAASVVLTAGCGGGRERQENWVVTHPDAPTAVKRAVLSMQLETGMTTDAVVASWGEPAEKVDLLGGDARWTYNRSQTFNRTRVTVEYILVFKGGILSRVETLRGR